MAIELYWAVFKLKAEKGLSKEKKENYVASSKIVGKEEYKK